MVVRGFQLGEGSSLTNLVGSQVLGGDGNKGEKGERKRSIEEEKSLVATKSSKPSNEEIEANINSRLPPELLSAIFCFLVGSSRKFLPFSELKRALLVCRWEKIQIQYLYLILQTLLIASVPQRTVISRQIISVENLSCAGGGGTLERIHVCGQNSSFVGPRPGGPQAPIPGCRMSSP